MRRDYSTSTVCRLAAVVTAQKISSGNIRLVSAKTIAAVSTVFLGYMRFSGADWDGKSAGISKSRGSSSM